VSSPICFEGLKLHKNLKNYLPNVTSRWIPIFCDAAVGTSHIALCGINANARTLLHILTFHSVQDFLSSGLWCCVWC